jgi:hypothetical protein
MEFCTEYPKLEPSKQEQFKAVVTRLLSGHVLTPGPALQPDPDWRFAEKYEGLIDAYLRIGGWRIELDPVLRLCRAIHTQGRQRVQFSKLESLILCVCRLVYHEEMQRVGEEETCELTVGQLRERVVQAGKPLSQVSRTALTYAVRRLARHELVVIDRGFAGADDERVVIAPVIEKILPHDKIADLYERVREYTGGKSEEGEGEEGEEEEETEEQS